LLLLSFLCQWQQPLHLLGKLLQQWTGAASDNRMCWLCSGQLMSAELIDLVKQTLLVNVEAWVVVLVYGTVSRAADG